MSGATAGGASARVATIRGGQGIASVRIAQVAVPQPGPGEALVRMVAATLNYRDLIMAKGLLPGLAKPGDLVPLSCAAAVVEAVGEGVTRVVPGQRVSPLFALGWIDGPQMTPDMLGGSHDGVARDYACFDADSLVLLPDELGDLEAATLPCAGLTAWSALFGVRPVGPGDWVLVQGTGGVSIAALQWAKAAGAQVAVTSSSDAKLARGRALGADLLVNYRAAPAWDEAVRAGTGGRGADLLVDVVGQGERARSVAALAPGAPLMAIGMLDGAFNWDRQEIDGHPVVPIGVGNRGQHEAMLAFAATHGIRPVVDAVYPLERLGDAMRRLEAGDFFGKVAISFV